MTLSHVSKIKRIMCIMQTMEYIAQDLPKAGDTVLVGLSGGVDSTLTAFLLKKKGCRVIGVTMSLWDGTVLDVKITNPEQYMSLFFFSVI